MPRAFLITGASGFLGSHVCRELLARGERVAALVRSPLDLEPDSRSFSQVCIDFDRVDDCIAAIEALDIEDVTFLHFAWPGVNRSGVTCDDLQAEGVELSKRCLDIAKAIDVKHFVFCGSRAEYGNCSIPMKESMVCSPANAYGRAKNRFHRYARKTCSKTGMTYLNLRPFSVIGEGDHPWSIVSSTCRAFANDLPMHYGPCTQNWNFMSVGDFARAVAQLCDRLDIAASKDWDAINVASWDTRTLRSFIEDMRTISRTKSDTLFLNDENSSNPLPVVPDISRMCDLIDWKARETFQDVVLSLLKMEMRQR